MASDDTLGTAPPDRQGRLEPGDVSSVELVRRARDGDREALDRLFARYLPILRRWAAGRLPRWARDLVDTDDMIQDTMIKTFRNVENFVPRHDGASPLEQALGSEALRKYEEALRRLPDEDRDVVLARIEMGLSYQEVASATNKPSADAARMAVSRALVRLAKEMDRE